MQRAFKLAHISADIIAHTSCIQYQRTISANTTIQSCSVCTIDSKLSSLLYTYSISKVRDSAHAFISNKLISSVLSCNNERNSTQRHTPVALSYYTFCKNHSLKSICCCLTEVQLSSTFLHQYRILTIYSSIKRQSTIRLNYRDTSTICE